MSTARKQPRIFGSGRHGVSVAEIIDQLTDNKEVNPLYSAQQGSQEPLVRTEISKMSRRQKQMVATLGLDRYRSN